MKYGQVESFNPFLVETYVNCLLHADETERALLVLDNLPAFYRDNMPPNLKKLRDDIVRARITPHGYLDCDYDSEVTLEKATGNISLSRFQFVQDDVERFNKADKHPHIVDCGPGEYVIPIGLKSKGLQFTYEPLSMDQKARAKFDDLNSTDVIYDNAADKTSPYIFCALEIIEHLPDPLDLATEALSHYTGSPDVIHMSTPLYTYDGRIKEWNKVGGLPHLRAYTPNEFFMTANKIFPGYKWDLFPGQIISLRGVRLDLLKANANPA